MNNTSLLSSVGYNLNTIDISSIKYENNKTTLHNFFWHPNPLITNKLLNYINKNNLTDLVIDVGSGFGHNMFPKATHILGLDNKTSLHNITQLSIDLDFDKFSLDNKYFDFAYCRHTLEDLQNPQNAFNEIIRIAKHGYIETPSPLIELTRGADKGKYCGYIHHRYIVWSDLKTNTLYFLPKYPCIEYIDISDEVLKTHAYILNNYPVYWNNYYIWDAKRSPNIVVYRNEVNFNFNKDYSNLLNTAVHSSIEYTNKFISYINTL